MRDRSEDTQFKTIERHRLRAFNYGRKHHLKKTYNISLEKYEEMLYQQNNCCEICGNSSSGAKSRYNTFAVDHDHKTGKIRGLLCVSCNLIVVPSVEYYDNRLEATKKYLEKYR
jgi:hypothetical protein